jgi:hypothetical protein
VVSSVKSSEAFEWRNISAIRWGGWCASRGTKVQCSVQKEMYGFEIEKG